MAAGTGVVSLAFVGQVRGVVYDEGVLMRDSVDGAVMTESLSAFEDLQPAGIYSWLALPADGRPDLSTAFSSAPRSRPADTRYR